MHSFFAGLRPTLHISHRGGALLAPENTFAAFEPAVERWRTEMLELDVQLSADGEVVVFHDDTLDRCTEGHGRVEHHDLATLKRLDAGYRFTPDGGHTHPFRGQGVRIPTLREVFRAFPGLRINVEVKRLAAAEPFVRLVREEGAAGRICCGSEHDEVALRLAEELPEACHFYPRQALEQLVGALLGGEGIPRDDRFSVLDMPLQHEGTRLVTPAFLAATRALGKWVNVWTIDDREEMRRLVADGVGGIMTDRPDILRHVLDETR